jgi:hypothetical protein
MNKFEKLIEYIINDEDQKARELFHDIVVEKSRDIYESIMDEESMEETVAGAQVEELANEVSHDESKTMEDECDEGEQEFDLDADGEDDGEVAGDFPADSGEEAEHEEIEDKVMNIDAKLDELLAKFDEIMGDEGHSEKEMSDEEPAMDMDNEMSAEDSMMEAEDCDDEKSSGKSGNPFAKKDSAQSGKSGSAKSGKSGKGSAELMREYVDKIGEIYGGQGDASEGDAVGAAGKKTSVNTKPGSIGPGNNFGGTAVTSKGGNQDQDGTTPTKASNEYNKGQGEIKSGNVNVPGGKAALAKGPAADRTSEESSVNDKPVQAQNTGKK